jgi:hypothetical protein
MPLVTPAPTNEVGFSTAQLGQKGSFVLRMRITRHLLEVLGNPKRIRVSGTPAKGLTIAKTQAAASRGGGVYSVYYDGVSPTWINFNLGLKPTGLSKAKRPMVDVAASLNSECNICVEPLPPAWVTADPTLPARSRKRKAARAAAPPEPPPEPEDPVDVGLPADVNKGKTIPNIEHNDTNGHTNGSLVVAVVSPNGVVAAGSGVTAPQPRSGVEKIGSHWPVETLRHRLRLALAEVAAVKRAIEEKTGMRLKITRDLHVVVDLDSPTGADKP